MIVNRGSAGGAARPKPSAAQSLDQKYPKPIASSLSSLAAHPNSKKRASAGNTLAVPKDNNHLHPNKDKFHLSEPRISVAEDKVKKQLGKFCSFLCSFQCSKNLETFRGSRIRKGA